MSNLSGKSIAQVLDEAERDPEVQAQLKACEQKIRKLYEQKARFLPTGQQLGLDPNDTEPLTLKELCGVVMTATGWTPSEIDNMDLEDFNPLFAAWRRFPPAKLVRKPGGPAGAVPPQSQPVGYTAGSGDLEILTVLCRQRAAMKQYDIADESGISREKVGKCLERMRRAGIVHRPHGPRGGDAAKLPEAEKVLDRLKSSAGRH